MKRRHRCSECGELGSFMRVSYDAGDTKHYFHPACWGKFVAWITKPIAQKAQP